MASCMKRSVLLLLLLLLLGVEAQPHNANPIDPRHHFDKRCPVAVEWDTVGTVRDPKSTSSYLFIPLPQDATPASCSERCCHDWSCLAFTYVPPGGEYPIDLPCNASAPCCIFKDMLDPVVKGAGVGVRSGRRAFLPAKDPPYPASAWKGEVEQRMYIGVNGDEFPITWGKDGEQYTGAGDNQQQAVHGHAAYNSPLSFFRVVGDGPEDLGCIYNDTDVAAPRPVCANMTLQGTPFPVLGERFLKVCPTWGSGIPNTKSSSVLSVKGVLYWAVSCFNYGDDAVFNRQRYGPAFIVVSTDGGRTFDLNATSPTFFPGRLSAPRFVQYGKDYQDAVDGFVYAYFPGANTGAAFFENNDAMLLGRVPVDDILHREKWTFYMGRQSDGEEVWSTDWTLSAAVWTFPLMTSVQQVNYVPSMKRYVFANWAWISADGNPRPDHSPDERNDRTGRQRSQLLVVEAPTLTGPFSIIHRDDNWSGPDGSRGGYTPVFPPKWVTAVNSSYVTMWMVYTQCCGNLVNGYLLTPPNHYNFVSQKVTLSLR